MIENKRILVVDDDPGVRDSYKEILCPAAKNDVLSKGASLFGGPVQDTVSIPWKQYDLVMAEKGEQGIKAVKAAFAEKTPLALAFIDMNMPGIDGAETSKRIWAVDSDIKIVIVTAYSEYTPDDIIRVTGRDDIFYLRKPFNSEEIRQFARALTNEWNLERERERLHDELEDVNKNLQKKVEEQTALLVQSEKMASIGILAAGVAHEINNPIAFVNGNLSAIKKYCVRIEGLFKKYKELEACLSRGAADEVGPLLEEITDFKEKKKIDFILGDIVDLAEESLEGTERVRRIVNDLRSFSRMDEAELKRIDLNEAMDTTINIIWNELKYKTDLVRDYGDLPEVNCFPQKISQVFMNILVNAAQAIGDKGTITISTRYIHEGRRAEDNHVEIKIADTGHGISPKDISKIFDPFFTTKPPGQGTGLGLSISYDIVKAHGGEIKVQSNADAGSAFIISLPV